MGPTSNQTARSDGRVPVGAWIHPGNGRAADDAIAALAGRAVVLLGETHDEPEHHRWQLHTIAALHGLRPDTVLGFEMFPRRVQPALDRWSNGELNEAVFLANVDWPRIWGFDAALYLPLFHFARMHRVPMLALNVDRETNRRVAAEGPAVARAGREDVGDPAPVSASYRDRLFGWFRQHGAGRADAGMESAKFERFVRAQLFWDRAMAEAIAGACGGERLPMVVGLMGSGHIEYGHGVPHQLAALGINDVGIALPWRTDTDYPSDDPPIADILFGVAPPQA